MANVEHLGAARLITVSTKVRYLVPRFLETTRERPKLKLYLSIYLYIYFSLSLSLFHYLYLSIYLSLSICTSKFTHLPRNLHFKVYKVLHLPRNLHFKVHKVLRLPRNLHFKVHKVLRLRRLEVHKVLLLPHNLHFKDRKVLCLPGNLHFKVHKVLPLPRKPKNKQNSQKETTISKLNPNPLYTIHITILYCLNKVKSYHKVHKDHVRPKCTRLGLNLNLHLAAGIEMQISQGREGLWKLLTVFVVLLFLMHMFNLGRCISRALDISMFGFILIHQ